MNCMQKANNVCPRFLCVTKKDIECEGVIPGSYTVTRFRRAKDCQQQLKLYCNGRCEYCEIYRAREGD